MASRGVVYITWGEVDEAELESSIESISHLNLPHRVIHLNTESHFGAKARMFQMTPFDETLFLDTDTIVLEDLSYGFEMSQRFGVAITIAPACYASREVKECHQDLVEYNTGVVFFKKDDATERLFNTWVEYSPLYPNNDQLSFALAANKQFFNPYVLQPNWNYRAHLMKSFFFGPIKIWHSRMTLPVNIGEWNSNKKLMFGKIEKKIIVRRDSFLKLRKTIKEEYHIEELYS